MTLRVHLPARARVTVSSLSWFLLAGGLAGVLVYTWSVSESWVYQETQRAQLPEAAPPVLAANRVAAILPRKWFPPDPLVLGRLEVPRLGLSAIIRDGVDAPTLRKAVGHVPTTPLPGEWGNSVVAGHRDTFFRGLREIARGDRIRVVRRNGVADYIVDGLAITGPESIEVMQASADKRITLITCYPFGYVGSAPRRFVVTARSIASTDNGDGH